MNNDLVIILPGQRRVKIRANHPLTEEELKPCSVDWIKELEWVKHVKDVITFYRYETPLPRRQRCSDKK